MSYPIGQYECKLDSKGRLMMPACCKEQFGAQADEGFVLRPGSFNKCLELYTYADWERMQSKLRTLNPFVRANQDLLRKYNSGAMVVKLDATGRLQIPKMLVEKGGLDKDVVLTSLTVKMEIWDKTAYEEAVNSIDAEQFEALTAETLSNLNFND